MSRRVGFVQSYVVGAALIGSALLSTGAGAQQGCCEGGTATGANAWTAGNNWKTWVVDTPVFDPRAPAPEVWPVTAEYEAGLKDAPAPYWWTHGEVEFGGRSFVNDPSTRGQIFGNTSAGGYVFLGQHSLAKYYEYSIVAPGAFAGGHVATGSSDGLYQVDLWANNIGSNFNGFSDQSYLLEASKAGQHYVSVAWDQTPHIYSTSAQTPWLGVGTNNLTLPTGLVAKPLVPAAGYAGIAPYLHPTDLGIERDTVSFAYRWTPTTAWDINTYYSHMDRTGTQNAGIVELNGFQPTQIPAPVNDTTQNFGAGGEYVGSSLWGQRYTFKLAYTGSVYTDNISSYFVQNPFFPTVGTCKSPTVAAAGTANCVAAQMSTPPSNAANGFSATMTADLPLKTRYAGTLSFTEMTQNDTFLPMTNNPLAATGPFGPWNQVNFGFINGNLANPANHLNGQIDTLLSNNTLTTQINPELTSKLTYRYYDFDNQSPRIIFPCWISYDGTGAVPGANPCGGNGAGTGFEKTISSLAVNYIKQNAGAQLNWRPDREWNFNAAYGFERYDYSETDVNVTNEHSVKLSGDWRPASWVDFRLGGSYADRRYDTYNYLNFVQSLQFPTVPGFASAANTTAAWFYSPAYRQFMFDNRERTKADFLTNIVIFPGVTVSPSVKYTDDYYGLNPLYTEGINDSKSLSWGVDVAYVPFPGLSLFFSYYREKYDTLLYSSSTPGVVNPTPATLVVTSDKEYVNTITAAVNFAAIPNILNLDLRYTISDGLDVQNCLQCSPAFPNNTTFLERIEATATYKLDPDLLGQTGFNDMKVKLRYTWERNAVTNWQNDPLAPFTAGVSTSALWLTENPNYNVHMVAASLVLKW